MDQKQPQAVLHPSLFLRAARARTHVKPRQPVPTPLRHGCCSRPLFIPALARRVARTASDHNSYLLGASTEGAIFLKKNEKSKRARKGSSALPFLLWQCMRISPVKFTYDLHT